MTREKEVKKIWNFYYYTYTASSTDVEKGARREVLDYLALHIDFFLGGFGREWRMRIYVIISYSWNQNPNILGSCSSVAFPAWSSCFTCGVYPIGTPSSRPLPHHNSRQLSQYLHPKMIQFMTSMAKVVNSTILEHTAESDMSTEEIYTSRTSKQDKYWIKIACLSSPIIPLKWRSDINVERNIKKA
jgi:hypothetical protein